MIYTDIQKKFDSVSHYRLIKTFTQSKVQNDYKHKKTVSWFKEFLNQKTQKVEVNKSFSDKPFLSGVPLEVDNCSNINLFPDDANIYSQSNKILKFSLDKMYHWLKERKLNLNPSKCHVLNIQKQKTNCTDCKINNIKLPITHFKDLGVFITDSQNGTTL